jgi:hypothetical protein
VRLRRGTESEQQSERQPHSDEERNRHCAHNHEQHRELGDHTGEESDDAITIRVGHDFSHDHGAGQDSGRGSDVYYNDHDGSDVYYNDHDVTSASDYGD